MALRLQLEYWKEGPWLVGRLTQVPGVFSQGATLEELEENILDAYRMMREEQDAKPASSDVQTREIEVPAQVTGHLYEA
jgi:predicted RNase H-like HicB family nuclease